MVQMCAIYARYVDDNNNEEVRQAELKNADWAYGMRNPPIFCDLAPTPIHGDVGSPDLTFLEWDKAAGDPTPTAAEGRLVGAKFLATYIRTYKPEVIVTQDYDGEYGHDDHMAIVRAVADAYAIAADPTVDLSGLPAWQTKKLYMHEYNRTPSVPMVNKLLENWDIPTPELGWNPSTHNWNTPMQVADDGLQYHVCQLASVDSFLTGAIPRYSEQFGLYMSTVGADTVGADGWAHGGFFEHIVLVPEPASMTLLACAGGFFALRMPRRRPA
jgi:hypothetical protein